MNRKPPTKCRDPALAPAGVMIAGGHSCTSGCLVPVRGGPALTSSLSPGVGTRGWRPRGDAEAESEARERDDVFALVNRTACQPAWCVVDSHS